MVVLYLLFCVPFCQTLDSSVGTWFYISVSPVVEPSTYFSKLSALTMLLVHFQLVLLITQIAASKILPTSNIITLISAYYKTTRSSIGILSTK